jgi:hypothetical protein
MRIIDSQLPTRAQQCTITPERVAVSSGSSRAVLSRPSAFANPIVQPCTQPRNETRPALELRSVTRRERPPQQVTYCTHPMASDVGLDRAASLVFVLLSGLKTQLFLSLICALSTFVESGRKAPMRVALQQLPCLCDCRCATNLRTIRPWMLRSRATTNIGRGVVKTPFGAIWGEI